MTTQILFSLALVLIFLFTLTNGFLDGGGIVSTVITTRTMDPLPALVMVACCEVAGLFLLGRAVTHTLGVHLITFPAGPGATQTLGVLCGAVLSALGWNLAMWRLSLPTSSSHALLGGLLGAAWVQYGAQAINGPLVVKILIGLAVVPMVAALAGFLAARFLYWAGQFLTPAAGRWARALHAVVLAGVALAHGSNDGQKSLALVLLAVMAVTGSDPLSTRGLTPSLPWWVVLACGMTLGLGVLLGSRRTIHTVGQRFYRVQSLQGLCAGSTAMMLVGASSLAGFPMSSSHVMSSAVLGAGAAVRPRGVRWGLAGEIALAWFVTIPAAAAVSAILGKWIQHVVS